MSGHKNGAVYRRVVPDGESKVIDLADIGCEGFISGSSKGGTLTLEGCHDLDGVDVFGTQAFASLAPEAFAAIGPYKYLKYTQAGGEGYIGIE